MYISVIEIWNGTGSDNIPYKAIKFSAPTHEFYVDALTGEKKRMCVFKPLTGTHIAKQHMIVDGQPVIIQDPTYYACVGDSFMGAIIRREVKPYTIINDKGEQWRLNYLALPVFGDPQSDDFEHIIKSTFDKRGYELIRTGQYIRERIAINQLS